jgi:hypothetical protein
MNPDTVAGWGKIALAVLILAFVWINRRWNKADADAEREALRKELARRLTLPARLIARQPNHPGNWNPDGADSAGSVHRGLMP